MSETNAAEGGFDFRRGTSEHTVLSNVDRTLTSLLPETVSSDPTVRWLRTLQEGSNSSRSPWRRSDDARDRDFYYDVVGARPLGRVFLMQSILQPVVQTRLDFLMQSLYPVARIISVSERAIELIADSRRPEHIERTLNILRDSQHLDIARLREAATESLADLLAVTADLHRQRRAAGLQALEDWLVETNAFRAAFEPADSALGQMLHGRYGDPRRRKGYRYSDDIDLGRALAPLVAYLSRSPRLGSVRNPDNLVTMNQRRIKLSPGEIAGLVAALQGFPRTDEPSRPRDYEMAIDNFSRAFFELSKEPLIQAELATLQQRITNLNPFSEQLIGPPNESLRAEMKRHVLSNRERSPWLRQFLMQFDDEPRWWRSDAIQHGSAHDSSYVQALAFSAHSTIIRQLIEKELFIGEPWGEYIERLLREEWVRPLRKAISRSSNSLWTRESFIAVMAAVRERLHGDGYRLSIDDQAMGGIWDSALGE